MEQQVGRPKRYAEWYWVRPAEGRYPVGRQNVMLRGVGYVWLRFGILVAVFLDFVSIADSGVIGSSGVRDRGGRGG